MPAPDSIDTPTFVLDEAVDCVAFQVAGSLRASPAVWNALSAAEIAFSPDWWAVTRACWW